MNDFVVFHSDEVDMHFMMYNSQTGRKLKQKCVLTNSFEHTAARGRKPDGMSF